MKRPSDNCPIFKGKHKVKAWVDKETKQRGYACYGCSKTWRLDENNDLIATWDEKLWEKNNEKRT